MFMSAWSVFRTFWQTLEEEIVAAGGSVEMLDNLAKKHVRPAIKQFAIAIVKLSVFRLSGSFSSHAEAIKAGGYDYLYGVANNPSEIKGVAIHPVDCDTVLGHPNEELTTQQIYDRYFAGDNAADLSDLEMFGIKHPDVQRQFPVVVIWKVGDEFWYAVLHGGGSGRNFYVDRDDADVRWSRSFRFLARKSRA